MGHGLLPVGFLDLILSGVSTDVQDLVVVFSLTQLQLSLAILQPRGLQTILICEMKPSIMIPRTIHTILVQ